MNLEGIQFEGPFLYSDVLRDLNRKENRNAVYALKTADGKYLYVGSSSRVHKRFSEHSSELKLGMHPKKELQDAYNAGEQIWFYYRLCPSLEIAVRFETKLLTTMQGTEGFLNVAIDGEKPWMRSPDYIHPLIGTSRSDEVKQAVSETRKRLFAEGKLTAPWTGKTLSEETREKISQSRIRLYESGYKTSEETRQLLSSQRQKGKHNLAKRCLVHGIEYDCIASASEALGIGYGALYKRISQGKPGYALVQEA